MRYLELCASVFLLKSIPAWSSGHTGRAIGTPKLAFVDTGVACHVLGQDAHRLGVRVILLRDTGRTTPKTNSLRGAVDIEVTFFDAREHLRG